MLRIVGRAFGEKCRHCRQNTKHGLELEDPWGRPFRYSNRGSKFRYELGSSGEDREMGNAKKGGSAFGEGDDITIDNGRM